MMMKNPEERIGHSGFESIKNHPFFENTDWKTVYNREYTPPIIPKHRNFLIRGRF